jgi:uncharacterized protein (DUF1800 family)
MGRSKVRARSGESSPEVERPRRAYVHRALGVATLALLLAGSAGCGGGGGGGGADPGSIPTGSLLDRYALPGSGETFGEAEARHLLRRIAFAAPQAEVDRCVDDGLVATVDRLLNLGTDTGAEAAAAALVERPDAPRLYDLERSWLSLMVRTSNPVREKMALFWHQRLAVSGIGLGDSNMRWMREYRDILRTEGLGNWRRMLKAVAKNGAMLAWLSGLGSDKDHPNENFARELWELFTLGVDVRYTQADIQEAARADTGWDSTYDPDTELENLFFDADAHDDLEKTILGRTGNFREDDVVDVTLTLPEAATFLGRRLFEGLAYEGAEPSVVAELAKLAADGDWELKPIVRTVLLSRAFYSARARKTQVADPVVQMIGLCRVAELPFEAWDLLWHADNMAQIPLDPPSVKGFPQALGWAGEQPLLNRTVMADDVAGMSHTHDPLTGDDLDPVTLEHLLPPPDAMGAITGAATVDHLARLLDVALSAPERQVLVDYMDREADDTGAVVPFPFDGNDPAQIDVKLRGLLSILAQHPDALKN